MKPASTLLPARLVWLSGQVEITPLPVVYDNYPIGFEVYDQEGGDVYALFMHSGVGCEYAHYEQVLGERKNRAAKSLFYEPPPTKSD